MGSHGVFAGVSFNETVALNRRVAVYTLSQLPDPDPAELALKIVKRLQASERPTEVVIAGDGSIILKFKKNEREEDFISERVPVYFPGQSSEFVH